MLVSSLKTVEFNDTRETTASSLLKRFSAKSKFCLLKNEEEEVYITREAKKEIARFWFLDSPSILPV
jgi:hypothetical protein